MLYTSTQNELRTQFSMDSRIVSYKDSDVTCRFFEFSSENNMLANSDTILADCNRTSIFTSPDVSYLENQSFSYPVFTPDATISYKDAILLFHGLNERSWTKYLSWAYYLTEKTKRPVILFPIAYHMNRSPASWSNPRVLSGFLPQRLKGFGEGLMSTFANLAISERLTQNPLRFLTSGKQSAEDVTVLAKTIKSGNHPLFEKGANLDVFAYSIGAFLAQILFIGNPEGSFSNSRLFLFCGGAFFDKMDGVSKLIMDKLAFDRLRKYYLTELDVDCQTEPKLGKYLSETELGLSFRSMLSVENFHKFNGDAFRKIKDRMQVIALKNDLVIPAKGIVDAFGTSLKVEVLDFPFHYRHENPFPILENEMTDAVDKGFEKVFSRAAAFLK